MISISDLKPGALIWTGLKGPCLSYEEKKWIQKEEVSGIVFFKRNIHSLRQFYELCRELHGLTPPPLLAMDREGGGVDRLRTLREMPPWPSPEDMAGVCSLKEIQKTAFHIGKEMRALGLSVSLAPVWDHSSPLSPPSVLKGRLFSSPLQALAFARGLEQAGLPFVAKHFPGHGGVRGDSHAMCPVDSRSEKKLLEDLVPFQMAVREGADLMMSAHILYPAWDKDNIATFSEKILTRILRKKMGFKGWVISDDLDMAGAGRGSLEQKAISFLEAGGDIVLKCDPHFKSEELYPLPERLRQWGRRDRGNHQRLKLCVQRVRAFRRRFFNPPPGAFLSLRGEGAIKNSKSHAWCRNIVQRLKKEKVSNPLRRDWLRSKKSL